ncbi:MAG: ArsR/SmtB family transcription factor [Candidatus Hodarchaeales archaeon]
MRSIPGLEKFDVCCPTDHEIEILWEEDLKHEQEKKKYETELKEVILKTISHPLRLNTLLNLFERPHCVCELVKKLQIKNSAMSYHLSLLVNNELIETENRHGRTYNLLTEYGKSVVNWINGIPKDKEI